MQRVIADNALRHELTDEEGNPLTDEEGNPLTDEDGEVLLSEMSLADQRLAAEEFLAHLQETGGRDAADIYEENHEEIAKWGEEHGFDHLDPASREAMVRAWIADTGYTPKRPGWLKRLISGIRLFFHRRGWFVSHLSDDDILTILAQSAKAGRKRRYAGAGDGTRYAFRDPNGNIVQEFGVRNTQLDDDTPLNTVSVNTDNYVSTSKRPDEVRAHHLRTADADAELRRRIDAAKKHGEKYAVFNDDSQMKAVVTKNNSGEMRYNFSYSTVPGYVYAAAMVNIEPLFKSAKLCLSHDDRYKVKPDGSVDRTDLLQAHRFFSIMNYEGKNYAVKMTAKEWNDGRNNLYSLQMHETEIAEIKAAPAGEPPTGGGVEPVETGQSKTTFGQIKKLFDLPSNYNSATNITVISEKARLDAEKNARFLKKEAETRAENGGDGAVRQKFRSGNTSLRQVAAGFRKVNFQPGTVNLDLGGGKFDDATKFLEEKGVKNLVFDPVNRSNSHNRAIFDAVRNGGVDTVTCNNVLNVIQEAEARDNVILQAAKALKPDGTAYFTVYEGDRSGKGRQSQADAWQEHRKTADYLDEIRKHFAEVSIKDKVITARKPQTEGKLSAWAMDATFENPERFAGVIEFDSRIKNLVEILRHHVGQFMEDDPEHYVKILREEYDITVTPQEAYVIVQEACRKNRQIANQHARDARDTWLYQNYPIYAAAWEFLRERSGGNGADARESQQGDFLAASRCIFRQRGKGDVFPSAFQCGDVGLVRPHFFGKFPLRKSGFLPGFIKGFDQFHPGELFGDGGGIGGVGEIGVALRFVLADFALRDVAFDFLDLGDDLLVRSVFGVVFAHFISPPCMSCLNTFRA